MEINIDKLLIVDLNPYLKILIDDIKSDESLKSFFKYNDDKDIKVIMYESKIVGLSSIIVNGNIPELQAVIFNDYQRRGFGTATLNKLTKMCFEDNYPMVVLRIDKNNSKAMSQISKSGFTRHDINEEINPQNKEDKFYTFYKINYNYEKSVKR